MWNRKFKQKKKEDPKKKFFRYEAIEWCSVLALRRRCVSCAPLTRWENVGNKNTTVYVSFFSCSPLTLYSISFIYQNFGIGHKPGAQSNEQLSCIQRISFSCWMFYFLFFFTFISSLRMLIWCERTFRFVVSLVIFANDRWLMMN